MLCLGSTSLEDTTESYFAQSQQYAMNCEDSTASVKHRSIVYINQIYYMH
jgi:hypothetical protein